MKLRILLSIGVALLLPAALASAQDVGKIHGHVIDPTGVPKTNGTIGLSLDNGKTFKYTFQVDANGNYTGDNVAPGTYALIYRTPEMAPGKIADQIEGVKIIGGQDTKQDDDLSRQEYFDKMSPEQKKLVEEFKKKNADVVKNNSVIKNLNADLAEARQDDKDKKYDQAEALMLKDTGLKADSALLWYELGIAQLGLKKYDDAATNLKKASDLAAADKKQSPELNGSIYSALGEAAARNNKPQDAMVSYDEAAKAFPAKAASYYTNEAVVFSNSNNSDGSAAAADKAIAADPNQPVAYYLKGQALIGKTTADAKGNWILPPGMVDAYQKYLELAPNGPYAPAVLEALQTFKIPVKSTYKAKK